MKLINLLIITLLLFSTLLSMAQRRRPGNKTIPLKIEELPRRPVDTISTADPETKVIVFSNNTWEFYRPNISERLAHHDAYKFNWDTASIFAYRNVEHKDLPDITELKLFNSPDEFCAPMKGWVSSRYGMRRRTPHNGIDLPLKVGEPILSAFEGKVRYAKFNAGGYGNLVIVRHANGLETWYAHLNRLNVAVDDFVKTGQVIGFGGNSGNSYGAHLHFETRYRDMAFDPEFLIDFTTGQIRYQNFALEKRFFSITSKASEILEEEEPDPDLPGSMLANADDSTAVKVQKPKPAAPKTQGVYHSVKSGDTLGHIAGRYGVSVDQICRLNGITRNTVLQLNRKLLIK